MIPEVWNLVSLGDVITYKKGFAFNSSSYLDSGVRIIRISDTTRNSIHNNNPVYVSESLANNKHEYALNEGDIILSTVGSRPHLLDSMVGKAVQVPHKASGGLLNQNLVKLVPLFEYITNDYLFSMLKKPRFIYFISTLVRGNANQVSITLKELFQYKFVLPPLPEQKKIAEILSTWDKAIETVEKLIENSQQKKKALMQQLLTGKKRFPGFDGEWKVAELSKLCKFMKGQGLSKDKLSDSGQFKCILYGELYTRYSEVIRAVVNRTDHDEGIKSVSGDVLIPASTTTSGIDLANATSLKESGVLLSGDINILRTDKAQVNPDFLAYVLTHGKKFELARRAQGITIIHLYGKDIKHIGVALPSLDEQNKIVASISSVEAETSSLSSRLTVLQREKKALMQQLLTGKKRVCLQDGAQ